MRLSQLFTKTSRQVSAEVESINANLLIRAGFIHQELAGIYSFLPLGLMVLRKIEDIIRDQMNNVAQEVMMPVLSTPEVWQQTGRLHTVDVLFKAVGANDLSLAQHGAEYVINYSHEEIITPLVQRFVTSYRDLPVAVYQIGTKFRNEARAKSGLLRGREFRMKDLYSFHSTQDDLMSFYTQMQQLYAEVFRRVGLGEDTFITYASGGDFTQNYSHEFQTLLPAGEDTIYLDRTNRVAYNREIATSEHAERLGVDFNALEQVTASEVGNIFPLDHKYSQALHYYFTDENNQRQLVWMGCYGIGSSRLMGVLAEKFADERGLQWPVAVAPAQVHIVAVGRDAAVLASAERLYHQLSASHDVLYDDRDLPAGVKFADADLIGVPLRLTLSPKTLEQQTAELKARSATDIELVPLDQVPAQVSAALDSAL